MKKSHSNKQLDVKLQISFPKSDQDHRLQLININGSIFAILFFPLESQGPIQLYCNDWSLILLTPIKSKKNIVISAINVICLNEIQSEEGIINMHASNQLVKFTDLIHPIEKLSEIAEGGEFEFDDDPGALLHYYQTFEGIVNHVRENTPNSLSEAQKKFLGSLCSLTEKMQGKTKNLNIPKVLETWNIPHSQS